MTDGTGVESQIAEWRAYVAKAPAVDGRDVDELEAHLRDQIAELDAAGLTADEAFLVAVKRMGDLDTLSREFAREHSGRLWKQLVLSGDDEPAHPSGGWLEALVFALAAAVTIQVARLAAHVPRRAAGVAAAQHRPARAAVPRRRTSPTGAGSTPARWVLTAAPFVLAALVVNLYPYAADSDTELLVALHLPVVLWFAVAYPYMGGTLRSHERRMDFVRFTGEWVHLLRAHRARRRRAARAHRGDPRADRRRRRRAGRRVGAAVGRGRRRDRGGVARGVQAARRGEHGAGAHHALHPAVRPDADRRRGHLRRVRDRRRRVRPRAARRLRRPARGRARARPLRDVRAGAVPTGRADGRRPDCSPSRAPSCST